MKTMMTWLLGLAMALLSGLAVANGKVHSMTGSVSSAVGAAPAQAVKVGDVIPAGRTVVTAANSTVVLQFPDGQLASLTPNSRMTIEQYQFDEKAKSGNIALNLFGGGMRAITGLIGRNTPDKVAYKAGTATIGIRGTDTTFAVSGGTVSVVVSGGSITFTMTIGGVVQTATIPAGSGVAVTPTGVVTASGATVNTLTVLPQATITAALTALGGAGANIASAISAANSPAATQAITNAAVAGSSSTVVISGTASTTGQSSIITTPPTPTSP